MIAQAGTLIVGLDAMSVECGSSRRARASCDTIASIASFSLRKSLDAIAVITVGGLALACLWTLAFVLIGKLVFALVATSLDR